MSVSADTAVNASPPEPPAWLGYALAPPLVGVTTLIAVVTDRSVAIPNLSLIFVLPVIVLAVTSGWGAALLAAVGGVVCYNFFLIEPRYTLRVADPANVWALALFLVVATVSSAVAGVSRRRAAEAREYADQGAALQGLVRALVAAADRQAILGAAADALGRLFATPAVVILADRHDIVASAPGAGASLSPDDWEAARWALVSRLPTRADAYPVEAAEFDFWPVAAPAPWRALIGVNLAVRGTGRPVNPERLVEIVGGYLTVALERDAYAAKAGAAELRRQGDRVKADLLAAVSHDLKTPLSTILFTLQSLRRFAAEHDGATRAELLALAETETARLSGLVGNLLDMSRIEADAVAVRRAPASPAELVLSALDRAALAVAHHPVENKVTDGAPVLIDYSLAEIALRNVIENAAKYSPAGTPIEIRRADDGDMAAIEVLDEGPGFPDAIEPLFERFARGVEGDGRPAGTGLGLAIARGFLEAQGGWIEARNRDNRAGALVRIHLPLAAPGPSA